MTVQRFSKKDFILRQGEVCRHVAYLNSGALLYDAEHEGKEMVSEFFFDDCWTACFLNVTPEIDLKVSYKKNYKKSTLAFYFDLQNITNNQNIFRQTYNPRTNSLQNEYQQGFFPVPTFRYTF